MKTYTIKTLTRNNADYITTLESNSDWQQLGKEIKLRLNNKLGRDNWVIARIFENGIKIGDYRN